MNHMLRSVSCVTTCVAVWYARVAGALVCCICDKESRTRDMSHELDILVTH